MKRLGNGEPFYLIDKEMELPSKRPLFTEPQPPQGEKAVIVDLRDPLGWED